MKKKTSRFLMLPLVCSALSSCVYYTPTVPDMPYQGSAGRTTYPDTWVTTQPAGIQQAPIPDPVASQPISQPKGTVTMSESLNAKNMVFPP